MRCRERLRMEGELALGSSSNRSASSVGLGPVFIGSPALLPQASRTRATRMKCSHGATAAQTGDSLRLGDRTPMPRLLGDDRFGLSSRYCRITCVPAGAANVNSPGWIFVLTLGFEKSKRFRLP